jgi:hypothetical protein
MNCAAITAVLTQDETPGTHVLVGLVAVPFLVGATSRDLSVTFARPRAAPREPNADARARLDVGRSLRHARMFSNDACVSFQDGRVVFEDATVSPRDTRRFEKHASVSFEDTSDIRFDATASFLARRVSFGVTRVLSNDGLVTRKDASVARPSTAILAEEKAFPRRR